MRLTLPTCDRLRGVVKESALYPVVVWPPRVVTSSHEHGTLQRLGGEPATFADAAYSDVARSDGDTGMSYHLSEYSG